jgi:hypothetical protein
MMSELSMCSAAERPTKRRMLYLPRSRDLVDLCRPSHDWPQRRGVRIADVAHHDHDSVGVSLGYRRISSTSCTLWHPATQPACCARDRVCPATQHAALRVGHACRGTPGCRVSLRPMIHAQVPSMTSFGSDVPGDHAWARNSLSVRRSSDRASHAPLNADLLTHSPCFCCSSSRTLAHPGSTRAWAPRSRTPLHVRCLLLVKMNEQRHLRAAPYKSDSMAACSTCMWPPCLLHCGTCKVSKMTARLVSAPGGKQSCTCTIELSHATEIEALNA